VKSIGDRLKSERESKSLSIDDVARDTNIAKKYLTALETEDFSVFPAEAYLLGFLKNYGEYLGLDIKELQSLYRVLKIQEQPVPVEQLLKTSPEFPKIIITLLIIIAGLGIVGGAVFFILNMPKRSGASNAVVVREPVEYTVTDELFDKRLFKGDTVLVPLSDTTYKITVSNLGELVTITTPVKEFKLGLNDEVSVDINSDGINELRITASDFVQNRPNLGAQLRFDLSKPIIAQQFEAASQTPEASSNEAIPTSTATANKNVIFISNNPYPFTLQIAFQGYCMFRWEILREADRQNRMERYFTKGEDLNIQAQNGVRIWASNAAVVKIQTIGGGKTVPVDLGNAGEIVVTDIYWMRDEDGRYRLVQGRLET
jgi:cytoskeletal protein RodZ